MRNNNLTTGKFIKVWLLHSLLYWVGTNGYTLAIYKIKLLRYGNYLWHEDGSPTTVWDRFYEMQVYSYIWAFSLIFILLVELVRTKFYQPKKFHVFVFAVIGAAIIWSTLNILYHNLKVNAGYSWTTTYYIEYFILYAIIYAVCREFIEQKLYIKDVRKIKAVSELNALKAQVNPHFFFNTFNYIYGTAMLENAPKTAKAIQMMTEMMRYTMSIAQEERVPLKDEIQFIHNYIELQQLRIPEKSNISLNILFPESIPSQAMIAPMLITPLIENAFKYGISVDKNCYVNIKVFITVNRLNIEIENSISSTTPARLGTGIKNTEKRLKILYKNAVFSHHEQNNTYKVMLNIPI